MQQELMAEVELMLSTPCSDRQAWERILMAQLSYGASLFRGPLGLLDEITARSHSFTEHETTFPPST